MTEKSCKIDRQVYYPPIGFIVAISLLLTISSCKKQQLVDVDAEFAALSAKEHKKFSLKTVPANINTCVINFFAPNCPPCIEELPELAALAKAINKKDTLFVGLGSILDIASEIQSNQFSLKIPEIRQVIKKFAKKHQIRYPVYLTDGQTAQKYGISGFPETFIFQRDKKQRWQLKRKFISAITLKEVQEYLEVSNKQPSLY